MRRPVRVLRHADPLQGPPHHGVQLGAAQPGGGRAEGDVLADGRHEELVVGVLEDDADLAADLGHVGAADREPGDGDGARASGEDAVQVQDEGGLAGAVRAEQGDPLAAPDGQVHPEEGLVAVGVGVGEAAHVEGGGSSRRRGHRVRPRRQIRRAASGSAAACAHWARVAVTSSRTGIVPV